MGAERLIMPENLPCFYYQQNLRILTRYRSSCQHQKTGCCLLKQVILCGYTTTRSTRSGHIVWKEDGLSLMNSQKVKSRVTPAKAGVH